MKRKRRGQTVFEYLLVTLSLLLGFIYMYRVLQVALKNQFVRGGMVILRMYSEDPW